MIDFLFITSPSNARNPHPPYYFMYLAAYLRDKGLKVKILDPKGGDRPKDIEGHLNWVYENYQPARFVGLAAFHSDYPMVRRMGRIVKNVQPDTILLVGNAHSTINPEDFIHPGSPFDIAVLGEGEETCWEIADSLDRPVCNEIKGVAFWYEDKIIKTGPRPSMDLVNLPMPAYDLIDMDWYLNPQKLIIRRIYTSMVCIFAGRGCPYNCDFCAANVIWKANTGKVARLRPVENVIEEIDWLKNHYHIDFFYMFDDMFGMSKKWMREWFNAKYQILDWDYKRVLPYACQTRADIITEEMIKGLKETGCIQVDIGVETGTQTLLNRVNKGITIQQVRQAVALCQKHKLRYFFTMLLNLPGETTDDLLQTYSLLKELRPIGVIFGITTPYPGTKIYTDHCHPALSKEEYSLLIANRLDPIERFRMAEHRINLERLWDKWNRRFKATPMFERMWPFQPLYWNAIWKSRRFWQYVLCWARDLPKTFVIYWLHKLRIYRFAKGIQYKRNRQKTG